MQIFISPAILLILPSVLLPSCDGFSSGKPLASFRKSPLRDSKSDDDDFDLPKSIPPFFASFSDGIVNGVDPSQSNGSTGTTASVTTRQPLGALFFSRDYIFNVATNMRGYEWELQQVSELFEDLSYATGDSNRDYELSQIVLVPMEWDTEQYGLGNRYDVYDGQQRLVTLCLLLSAMRESFREEASKDTSWDETVTEIENMLNPPKVRKLSILRIELRKRDNTMLERILLPKLNEQSVLDLPLSNDRDALSKANIRVLENYEWLKENISKMTVKERIKLLDYIVERVFLLVCVPESNKVARNIVMSQGKGMDSEPIDEFKGLVAFRYTLDDERQYQTYDNWDKLATNHVRDGDGSVGRKTVADACSLRAASCLKQAISKNEQLRLLEQWLREYLTEHKCQGDEFFTREVEPASLTLSTFRDGDLKSFNILATKSGTRLGKTIIARLRFLRNLISNVSSAKESEMVVLELLLRANGNDGFKRLYMTELDNFLRILELTTLWMVLEKPSLKERQKRCFALLDNIAACGRGVGDDDKEECEVITDLSDKEKEYIKSKMFWFKFGATLPGKRIAAAVLERINLHMLILEGRENIPEGDVKHWQVEHILPNNPKPKLWDEYWPDEEERQEWTDLISNLALRSRKATVKEVHKPFSEKKEQYSNELWPLTKRLSRHSVWDREALLQEEGERLKLVGKVWGL